MYSLLRTAGSEGVVAVLGEAGRDVAGGLSLE